MRVALAEDSVLLREGLARLLSEAGFDVVAKCADAQELRTALRSHLPDVVIVDIRLPPTHTDEGLQAAIEIRRDHPTVGVLVLSQYVELGLAMKLLARRAWGTCSRTASATFRSLFPPFVASPPAAPPSIPSSSRRC
jgi:DNA-binding NarL/FixJ family response regulator